MTTTSTPRAFSEGTPRQDLSLAHRPLGTEEHS